MAQYPVSDQQGIIDGLNYVLSGPIGQGTLIKGINRETTRSLPGYSLNTVNGQLEYNLPIITAYQQNYVTDLTEVISVYSGQDRVAVSGGLDIEWEYTAEEASTITFTVMINRYFGAQSFDPAYNGNLYFYDTTCVSRSFDYQVDTNSNGIASVSVSGLKASYPDVNGGSLYPAFDSTFVNQSAQSPGTGQNANVGVQLSYNGSAAYTPPVNYDLTTNTKILINAAGDNWNVGETILIPGASLGGATPANNMTITVNSVGGGNTAVTVPTIIFPTIYDQPNRAGVFQYVMEVRWEAVGTVSIDNVTLGPRSISTQVIKP